MSRTLSDFYWDIYVLVYLYNYLLGHIISYLLVHLPDRTVKIWDLTSGREVLTLDKHFSYVRCVRYCSRNRLIFTASQSLIKVCLSLPLSLFYPCLSYNTL